MDNFTKHSLLDREKKEMTQIVTKKKYNCHINVRTYISSQGYSKV